MFVLSVLEALITKTNSLCVQTHLALKLFLILIAVVHPRNDQGLDKKLCSMLC